MTLQRQRERERGNEGGREGGREGRREEGKKNLATGVARAPPLSDHAGQVSESDTM